MYLQQLSLIIALACVLSQAEPHFGYGNGGLSVNAGGSNSGSLVGDLLRASANVKNQLAEVADSAANRVRGMFHKKGQSSSSVGFQTGYVFQPVPYGSQPPINAYGGAPNAGAGFSFNGGIAPAGSYDSSRPALPSGNLGGHVNVGLSGSSVPGTSVSGTSVAGSSVAGSLLGDDHLEYVSATGERRRLSYEEVVQLIMIVIDSSKTAPGPGGVPAGGYAGVPAGGYGGVPAGGYGGVSAGGYAGVPAGGYGGVSAGGYGGAPAGGYGGAPAGGYPTDPTRVTGKV